MSHSPADLAAIIASHPKKATATLGDGTTTVDGIFSRPSRDLAMFQGNVNSTDPRFITRQVDVDSHGMEIDTIFTVGGQEWQVYNTDERNDGMVELYLRKYA